MRRINRVIILIVLIGTVAVSGVFAKDAGRTESVTVSPLFSFQRIFYSVDNYTNRNGFGLGAEIAYDHFLNSKTTLGLASSYEFFVYRDWFNYNDFKIQATAKRQIALKSNDKAETRLYATAGAGCDLVLRNDGDFGAYPLVNLGLETAIRCSETIAVTVKAEVGLTKQNGSVVLQANAGVGIRTCFGKPAAEEKK